MIVQWLKQNRQAYEYICANLLPLFSTTPILVYQMGRGGSSSLRNSLMRCQEPETNLVFHFHDFFPIRKMHSNSLPIDEMYREAMRREILHANEVYAGFPVKQKVNWFLREHFYTSSIYRNIIRKHRRAKIITLVREPISTNISMFFQLFQRYAGVKYDESQLSTQEIIDLFLTRYNFTRPLTWFDVEMKPALGIDVYQYPFPQEKGYAVIRAGNLELLTLKAEVPDSTKAQVVAQFIGLDRLELVQSNVSMKKGYARQYQEFKQMIRLSDSFVDEMYNSKYATHFYSDAERDMLRSYWLDRS